ncbi:hypothetical protein C8Q72DRAFT_298248 [Fomitopsis betulina]|nr:hypothetical protein C8Q72DRAFT_298248 [Fomitopsis betulina]
MFAKKALVLALLSICLSASAAPAADCTITQTITAKSSATSAVLVASDGKGATGSTTGKGTTGTAGKGTTGTTGKGTTGNKSSSSAAAASTGTTGTNTGTGSTSNNSGSGSASALQSSLTLDSSLIQTGFSQNGQTADSDAGQVASATSDNNFINFCATTNLPLTNGTQIKTGSCNGAPMGMIAATTAMPSAKFVFPKNLDTVQANTNFTVQLAIQNINTGFFVNPNTNFFAAPQALGSNNLVNGHSHVVIEAIDSLTSTSPTDPTKFNFFKGLNDVAENGILSTVVAGGLPAGTYKISTINSAANHQPVLVAVAQHGSLDDAVYFTVSDNGSTGSTSTGSTGASAGTGSTGTSTGSAAGASAAAGKTTGKGKGATTGKAATGAAGKTTAKGKRWLWE